MPKNVMIRFDQEFVAEKRIGQFANRPAFDRVLPQ
jgi:hypothetical protein